MIRKLFVLSVLALMVLSASAWAHDLNIGLSEDALTQNARFSVQVDGWPWKVGLVTESNYLGQYQSVWLTLPDGPHNVTVTLTNSGANLYVAWMSYDNVTPTGILFPVELQSSGSSVTVAVGQQPSDIPDPALYQGYTVKALDSDFTAPLATNWLGVCRNGPDGSRPTNFWDADPSPTWSLNLWWWFGNDTCSIYQVTDPAYGNKAIDLAWTVNPANTLGTAIESTSPTGSKQVSFPNDAYYEIEFRIDPPATTADGVFVTWADKGIVSQDGAGLELDIVELVAGAPWASDSTTHNFHGGESSSWWIIAPNAYAWWNTDPLQYHKFGMLTVTYNNGTAMYACSYIDRVLQGCQTVPFGLSDSANRNILTINNTCDWWNDPTCGDRVGQVQHMYVKHVDVWTRGD